MAPPVFQAAGTVVAGTAGISVAWPTHLTDDVGILLVEDAAQSVSTPAGWTAIANIGTGTAGAAAATAIAAFYKRATSSAEPAVAITDTGTRQTAVIITFRGCIASGSPIDVSATSVQATTSTTATMPGLTTTVADTRIVAVVTNSLGVAATTIQPNTLSNGSLTGLVKRLNTQPDGTGGTSTTTSLPVGIMAFGSGGSSGDVGEGPDLVAADPRVRTCHFVPNIATIGAAIDDADRYGIQLVLNVAGNKGAWCSTINGVVTLDMGKYQANVSKFRPDADNTVFTDRLKFADAVRRKRIVFYVVDEPNTTNASNSTVPDIAPTDVNQMALIHKAVWNGYGPITIVRATANTLWGGWNGLRRPTAGYTGVDYCWLQYTNTHAKGGGGLGGPWQTPLSPIQVVNDMRTYIATNNINMGVVMSLNMWSGGIGVSTLGVQAAWDTDGPGGSSTLGFVVGDRDNGPTVVASLPNATKSAAANPEWIKLVATQAAADPDLPFLLYWQHVTTSSPSKDFINYYQRQDYRDALDAAITTGVGRTVFNGWRTPK